MPSSVARAAETPDIETSSDAYAARFSGAAGRYLLEVQAQAIRAVIPDIPHARILDVGGGHGQLIPVFAELGCDITVLGSDESCWERITRLGLSRSARFVTASLLDLPFPDRSFDIAVAVRLVSHVERWPRLLEELCRVARACILLDYPSKKGLNSLTPLLFHVKKRMEGNTRTYTSFSRRELDGVLNEAGYRITAEHKQFFLPMALHRAAGGRLRPLEWLARKSHLTATFGSPVVLRADRLADNPASSEHVLPASSKDGSALA